MRASWSSSSAGGWTNPFPKASPEGTPEWLPLDRLTDYPLVDDLPHLLPRTLADGPVFFAHYAPDEDGIMQVRFR
jgi:hypothetical protein